MKKNAWIISVNMGYGHQRTAFPLRGLAPSKEIIAANDYQGIPNSDRQIWKRAREFYELISRLKRIPLIGDGIFYLFNQFQKILSFYPKRDLSKPNFQLKQNYYLIKKGWGRDLIKTLKERAKKKQIPLISTFYTPAFMAENFQYPGEVFCIVCDADIARTWAPLNPSKSKIKYFAPTERVVERLKLYGVKPQNIFLTGFPLPSENIGTEKLEVLKEDLSYRILNLDPQRKYIKRYFPIIEEYIGGLPEESDHPLTIMFAVGGAGAQKEIGIQILSSLRKQIEKGEVKLILVAGIRKKVKDYFENNIKRLGFQKKNNIEIIFEKNIEDYFKKFNQSLRKTDILWTKPSEISFYSALGLPIIITPSIGSQEDFNRDWLLKLGSGIVQENPSYTNQWLFDLLKEGWFAEAAFQGFVEGEKLGTFNIQKMVSK